MTGGTEKGARLKRHLGSGRPWDEGKEGMEITEESHLGAGQTAERKHVRI